MERIDLYRLYELGAAVHPLLYVRDKISVLEIFGLMSQAKPHLNAVLGASPPVQIDICRRAAVELSEVLDKIDKTYFTDAEGNFSYPEGSTEVAVWHVIDVRRSVQNFEAVFRAEMQKAATYRVPKRGTYDVADLVDRAEWTFANEIIPFIGPDCLREYQQAGRCFAFGLYTASGYHSCRSIEAVLRIYYRNYTGKDDAEENTWGQLLAGLEAVSASPAPPAKTLDRIRHVKDFDRNPLSHLRAVLDQSDADVLLLHAKVVIASMAKDMMEAFPEIGATKTLADLFKDVVESEST
ncbi:MAG: hypothetical protein K0R27_336 [Xanthobacteraceae bacterium]|nr:hypothetical protein [Xanthobacteraceae bacterium]